MRSIEFYVTSRGNHFMVEIAELYASALHAVGCSVEIKIDHAPMPRGQTDAAQIVVSPHEFYGQFLRRQCAATHELEEITRNIFALCVEQPGTDFFDQNIEIGQSARGVLDISRHSIEEHSKRGIRALHAPLPYSPLLEQCEPRADNADRDIDVLFIGAGSTRRTRFFANNAAKFSRMNNRFVLTSPHEPALENQQNCRFGAPRNALFQRAKVLVNLHAGDVEYFEWHRAMLALANRCVLLSEQAAHIEPLVNGEHLLLLPQEEIVAVCEELINNPQKREAISSAGYKQLRQEFAPERFYKNFSEKLDELEATHRRHFVTSHAADDKSTVLKPAARTDGKGNGHHSSKNRQIEFHIGEASEANTAKVSALSLQAANGWPLVAAASGLRRIFDARKRNGNSLPLTLTAVQHVEDRGENSYAIIGEKPQFLVKTPSGKFARGWHVISYDVKVLSGVFRPRLFLSTGRVIRECEQVILPLVKRAKQVRQSIFITSRLKKLYFEPSNVPCVFTIDNLRIEPLKKIEAQGEYLDDMAEGIREVRLAQELRETRLAKEAQDQREELMNEIEGLAQMLSWRHAMTTNMQLSKFVECMGGASLSIEKNKPAQSAQSLPQISVIVTLYNYEQFIEECLNSAAQTLTTPDLQHFDIVIVDDASTDFGVARVREWMKRTSIPVTLISKVFNTGLAESRNIGLRHTSAPYVFILDADNTIFPHCLSALYKQIRENDSAAAYGILAVYDEEMREGRELLSKYEWSPRELVKHPYIDAMALFKRDVVLKLGGYDSSLASLGSPGWEDYDLWLRMAQAEQRVTFHSNIVAAYRTHDNSMMKRFSPYTKLLLGHFKARYGKLMAQYKGCDRYFSFPADKCQTAACSQLA